ncbi:lipid kinase [Nocardioides mangrovicus]|uniref:Lipid kinase n=1 Tax=Nocardioides mangrovicus TaxID=2478913 RepID=A0A3L8NXX1_9ACTN|nr:lipid kinase [Nocardioides mangrovicus]RLV47774.1 lipid kinase [Nocardioides mangrovicus]
MLHASDARRVAVVLNAGSRRGAASTAQVRRLLADSPFADLSVDEVSDPRRLPDVIAERVGQQVDLLVVGGGDGTISCAADHVAGTAVTLGVLPLGTANDFARTLQLPTDLGSAVHTLVAGKVVDVDLGRVDGRAFLNVASVGLSVGVTERLTPGLKKRLGPLAYPVATLAAYRHHEPFTARLEFPDGDHEPRELTDLLQVAVGNGRHYGGGNAVSPTASLDDHLLDVYAVVRGRLRDHLRIVGGLKDGRLVEHEQVAHVTTRRVRVVTDPPLPVNLDGEVAALTPAEFAVERNAVHVVVPLATDTVRLDGERAG